ncbi:hypothetical protein UFOVP968_25 [uncultured Caudovirales phage]|uniref:Uncharacterized protein n=1 Tax=uncultured Caudovirales phage TaxID=2100421 RepID=A0A6J7XJB5_9CAUD|nr:hypothetical protein UFOVP968_25 [uncultured Caudovirales phage]CAB4186009.1 hypothetical protein UFOVP1133_3 [uncultured Caudovirales phage]CAB4192416.1 hypothetical protein UFOVP1249_22 [uncultured Caudovirales phage]CAB4217119.1 hypothetical protein UFOVP1494_12 [uncultured Caudovirales phage]CAB5231089.1 hypothetical protein UFOVP1583_22 [uncultured Caudovirales phage]
MNYKVTGELGFGSKSFGDTFDAKEFTSEEITLLLEAGHIEPTKSTNTKEME